MKPGGILKLPASVSGVLLALLLCCLLQCELVSLVPLELRAERVFEPEKHCAHAYPRVDDIPHPVTLEAEAGASSLVRDKRDAEEGNSSAPLGDFEQQLRIKVFYHSSVKDLDKVRRRIVVEQVVPEAVNYWEQVLKVRSNNATIRLNRKCENNQYFLAPGDPTQFCKNKCVETKCGEFLVPEEHLKSCHTCDSNGRNCGEKSKEGPGIQGQDFILYVSAIPTRQCGESIGEQASTVAYAAHCQQEATLDRPIAGHTNICPKAIKDTKNDIQGLASTIKHEMLHALGFSSSLFAFFRDKEGKPLTERGEDGKPPINQRLQIRQWSDKIIKKIERPWNVRGGIITRSFSIMVTPKVVEEARNHFNCSTLEGAELEDQGGDGTALTHWEKRIFQNEAMTGTVHTQNPVYSRLTYAILEDSGWYLPNYDMAQEISWGKNLGCEFATKSCKELMELDATNLGANEDDADSIEDVKSSKSMTKKRYPFCNTLMATSPRTFCTSDGKSVGSCNLVTFGSNIPQQYQNFDAIEGVPAKDIGKIGSSVTLADFCPYIQEFTWKSSAESKERGTRCSEVENLPSGESNYALEDYRQGSKCFLQGSKWNQKSCSTLKQWKRFGAGCYPYECADGLLHIIVRNVSLPCEREGQNLEVRLKKGKWLHEGSIICPACSDFCGDACLPKAVPRVAAPDLKEDIDNTCFREGLNGLQGFFRNFGLANLAGGAEGAGSGGEE